ncbi:MAG: DNA polymerase III subunit epsilon [Chloroflexi bacterium]|nr:DNA polymerase III subunit epsilon [Chloroflexota bacterium]
MNRVYVALDLETTGLDRNRDAIIEIGMVKFRGSTVLETFTSLVNPQRPLPLKIQQLVGLSDADLADAPPLRALVGKVIAFVGTHPVVGHNIEFDLGFLRRNDLLLNNLAIDTFELATMLLPQAGRYGLEHLAGLLGIQTERWHRALNDAHATMELFIALTERLAAWDPSLLEEIAQATQGSDWQLQRLLRDLADEAAGAQPALLTRPGAARPIKPQMPKLPELPPLVAADHIVELDIDKLSALIEPGGTVALSIPNFEHREVQVEMLQAVASALSTPGHLLIEAGTGVGKSLAYLLPAMVFSSLSGQRVVISSNTINLQDQLVHKDIPALQAVLGEDTSVAVLKGYGNYLCLRQLRLFRNSRHLDADEGRVLAKVLYWMRDTTSGDRSELLLLNAENDVWTRIMASPETCIHDLCPHRQRGECYFYRARDRAERAHLVIVNHSLLLSDMMLENRILPEYQYAIVDEAHHLEDIATNQFGVEIGSRDLFSYFTSLSHQQGPSEAGILGDLPGLLLQGHVSDAQKQDLYELADTMRDQIGTAQRHLQTLFQVLEAFVNEHVEQRNTSDQYDERISLTDGLRRQPAWEDIEIAWENWSVPSDGLIENLERLNSRLSQLEFSDQDLKQQFLVSLNAKQSTGIQLFGNLRHILIDPSAGELYWLTLQRRDGHITLNSAPLSVAEMLAERFFEQKSSVILTSATLQTTGDFRFIKERLGLEDADELALGSPFNFKSAALLYVPNDLPEPSQPNYQKSVEKALVAACLAAEGRTMVLFTSTGQLNSTYYAIRRPLEAEGIVVFAQGSDGSRRQILDNFRSTDRSVLLGTRSFWEGVDVVGQALSCLVIVRLPFAVPTDPVFAARAATFDDPFQQYSLPDAILRFRQGFGRLIRSKDDFGVVVVLDKRILTKAYGKEMLRSLPGCTARQGPIEAMPRAIRRWLDPSNRH